MNLLYEWIRSFKVLLQICLVNLCVRLSLYLSLFMLFIQLFKEQLAHSNTRHIVARERA